MTPNAPLPFAAARASRNHGLAAFAAALLSAFALCAGAFLPRLGAPAGDAAVASPGAPATYAAAARPSPRRG